MMDWNYFIQHIHRLEDMMFRSKKKNVISKHDMYKCYPIFFIFWDLSFRGYSLVSVPKPESSA